jgi:cytoskeletal protein CcmA (bactofilin family)
MWRKEDGNPQTSEVPSGSANPGAGKATSSSPAVSANAPACVSQGIKIKGELTGSEDLFIDGTVDGKVTLTNSTLTVGPNAAVKADITARELVVRGRAEGKFTASERVQIWSTARVEGDIKTERLSIEDGAQVRGKLEAGKPGTFAGEVQSSKKSEPKVKEAQVHDQKAASGATAAGAD